MDLVDDHGRAVRSGTAATAASSSLVCSVPVGLCVEQSSTTSAALREPYVDGCGIEAVVRGERDLRDPAPELLVSRENG